MRIIHLAVSGSRPIKLRMVNVHIHADDKCSVPAELKGHKVIEWTWDGMNGNRSIQGNRFREVVGGSA
jgi:hypothetical protein